MGSVLGFVVRASLLFGIVLFLLLHGAGYVNTSIFLFVEITLLLGLAASLLPPGGGRYMPVIHMPFSLWLLPVIVYVVGQTEILLFRHTSLFYLLTLSVTLILTAVAAERCVKKIAVATALVGVSIALQFSVYVPSFGNDTWRDALWAKQILERGFTANVTIKHPAYQIPMVPLFYVAISLVNGQDAVWSSVILGLLYLIYLPIASFLMAKRLTGVASYEAPFLLLMTPLIVIWSVWYIPQVYAISILLGLLSFRLPLLLQLLLLGVVILAHPVVSVFLILILLVLIIYMKDRVAVKLLAILSFISLVILIVIPEMKDYLVNQSYIILNKIQHLFHNRPTTSIPSPPPVPADNIAFGYLSLSVLASVLLLVFLHGGLSVKISIILLSLPIFVSFIGLLTPLRSLFDFPRYFGLPAVVLLATFVPYGFNILKAKRGGPWYAVFLIAVAIVSFVFAGIFMPKNPYTANPHVYSLYGLVTQCEAMQLHVISQLLGPGLYLTDWRSGLFMGYRYLFVEPLWQGFKYGDIVFTLGGSYGLYIDLAYLKRFNGMIILREGSSDMVEAYSREVFVEINEERNKVIYSSGCVVIWFPRLW